MAGSVVNERQPNVFQTADTHVVIPTDVCRRASSEVDTGAWRALVCQAYTVHKNSHANATRIFSVYTIIYANNRLKTAYSNFDSMTLHEALKLYLLQYATLTEGTDFPGRELSLSACCPVPPFRSGTKQTRNASFIMSAPAHPSLLGSTERSTIGKYPTIVSFERTECLEFSAYLKSHRA